MAPLIERVQPNGLELSCPAEAGKLSLTLGQAGGPGAPPYPLARRVSFSEVLDGAAVITLRGVRPRAHRSAMWWQW